MQGKVVLIVLDGVDVGEAPDAAAFGDAGSDSIGNTSRRLGGLRLANLGRLGLGHLTRIQGTPADPLPTGAYGKLAEISPGKDSTTGHWEMCGIVTEHAFPTYPDGFPPEVIEPFETAIGRRVLGNKPASGTIIIQELGDEHLRSGWPIVYTSADSVFQIAAHEEVVPVQELYRWCEIARAQLTGEHEVGRVIARPFAGTSGDYARTPLRRDYTVKPPARSLLEHLRDAGVQVVGIGKIEDLFSGVGLSEVDHTTSNETGMRATRRWFAESPPGTFIYTNLNDFDTLWGHRNDVQGYAQGLRDFDAWLPSMLEALGDEDLLLITSDHGNDPTTPSTDHSREYVPLLGKLGRNSAGVALGTRRGLGDIAATVLEHYGLEERMGGNSFRCRMGPS
ncbi:MAG: phosphopentomutase [Candidatus Krumholzibacteriia bacterium]